MIVSNIDLSLLLSNKIIARNNHRFKLVCEVIVIQLI
jgi:hypothetical protein